MSEAVDADQLPVSAPTLSARAPQTSVRQPSDVLGAGQSCPPTVVSLGRFHEARTDRGELLLGVRKEFECAGICMRAHTLDQSRIHRREGFEMGWNQDVDPQSFVPSDHLVGTLQLPNLVRVEALSQFGAERDIRFALPQIKSSAG